MTKTKQESMREVVRTIEEFWKQHREELDGEELEHIATLIALTSIIDDMIGDGVPNRKDLH